MLKLYAFTCGWFQAELAMLIEGGSKEMIKAPVPAYLIDHPKGLALFDTGLGVRFRREIGFRLAPDEMNFEFDESADIAARLRAIGVDPGKINWIINSHFHMDHCGGNASIPNATVIVQSKELAAARANPDGLLYNPTEFDIGQPFRAIDGELDLFGDGTVVIFPTLGHTPGHQSARIRLASGDVVLAADCCYFKKGLDEMLLGPLCDDREKSLATLAILRDLRDRGASIFFGHDPDQWRSIPKDVAMT